MAGDDDDDDDAKEFESLRLLALKNACNKALMTLDFIKMAKFVQIKGDGTFKSLWYLVSWLISQVDFMQVAVPQQKGSEGLPFDFMIVFLWNDDLRPQIKIQAITLDFLLRGGTI